MLGNADVVAAETKGWLSLMLDRFLQNWVYATPPFALLLVGLYPFIGPEIDFPVYLSLPAYMLHQYEEHDNDRFRAFLNSVMGADKSGLSHLSIWVINVVFVWFLLLAVFYASGAAQGWSVLAAYLLAINGILHLIWGVVFRGYNPGLWTAGLFFIPLAIWIYLQTSASIAAHVTSAAIVLALHAVIMVWARRPA